MHIAQYAVAVVSQINKGELSMKKLLVLLLVICIGMFALASCGGDDTDTPTPPAGDETPGTPDDNPADDIPDEKPDDTPTECAHTGGTATCIDKAVCVLCGESYGDIDALGHSVATVWGNEGGKHFHACTNGCGAKFDEAECAGGTATCTDKAVCASCNTPYGEPDASAHAPAAEWTSADGKHFHACTNDCGAKLDEADCAGGTATCAAAAVCETCNNSYGTVSDDHAPATEWSAENGKHFHACTNGCGTKLDEAVCDGEANCMQVAVCSVCNNEHGGTVASNHAPAAEWTVEDGKHYHVCNNGCGAKLDEADCDGTASCVSAAVCTVCNTAHGEPDATAHNFAIVYTDDGHYNKCRNGCNTETEVKAHAHGDWKVATEATEESYGTLESVCECGHKITKASAKSEVLSVKGGANGIVVLIHDDAVLDTAVTIDKLLVKYGLVANVAVQVGSNGSTKMLDTNTASNINDDTYNGAVIASWREMLATGRWQISSHSMTHQYWGNGETVTEDASLVQYEVVKSQEILRYLFPGQRVLTWCYPGFSAQQNIVGSTNTEAIFDKVFSDYARDLISQYYISGRSTKDAVLSVTDTDADYKNQFAGTAYAESDVWNYFPSLSLGDNKINDAKNNITTAATNGGISLMFCHQVVDVMPENTSNKMLTDSLDQILSHLSTYVNDGTVWNAHYEDAILYLREAQSATVYTAKNDDGTLCVTLTDEMDDDIYNYPLTVRVSVPESWAAVKVVQGDRVTYATVTGGTFDAEIVPDGGEAIISSTAASNIPEDDSTVAPTPDFNNLNREFAFTNESDMIFVSTTLSGKVTSSEYAEEARSKVGAEIISANGGVLHTYKGFAANANTPTTINTSFAVVATNTGVTVPMADISFDMCFNSASIYQNNSYNALFQITFADSSPVTLFLGFDSTKNKWYIGESTSVIYDYFDIGEWYNVNFKFIFGDAPKLAIFVDGQLIGENTGLSATNKSIKYVKFTGQTRALYDMYLDNVCFNTYSEIKEYCEHTLPDVWTSNGIMHTKSCTKCGEVVLKGECIRTCLETCDRCGYNFGSSGKHVLEWQESASGDFSATCKVCGTLLTTSFKDGGFSDYTDLTMESDPAGGDRNVIRYTKNPNEANTGYNSEFTVTGTSLTAKKISMSLGVYVDSAAVALLTGESSTGNYRMVQMYISNFFKPFIGLDKNATDKWIMGHLSTDEKKTINFTEHQFDFDKWYTISVDMFLDSNLAVLYVDGVEIGSYNACNDEVNAISSVRFLGQYRCKCDVYFGVPTFSTSDTTINQTYDFENGLEGIDYTTTHENCVVTPVADPTNPDNTVIKFDRTSKSGAVSFPILNAEKYAEAVTLSFKIRVGSETTNGAELRILFSEDNVATPYMACIIKKADGFELRDRSSGTENIAIKQRVGNETYALDTWYNITITLHVNCCDYFLAEWTVTDMAGNESKAYSQLYANQSGTATAPGTTVSHIKFWAVGNNWVQHHYLDDVSVRAGGSGVINNHHPISKDYSAEGGYHFKACGCCDVKFGYEACDTTEATCTAKSECKICGTQYGEVNPDAHNISEAYTTGSATRTHFNTCENGCSAIFNETACTITEASCAAPSFCTVCEHVYAESLDHTFDGEITYNHDATAKKDGTVTGYCTVCETVATGILHGSADLVKNAFSGVNVSLIGDSISTFKDISNGAAADTTNSTIKNNSAWYTTTNKPSLRVGLDDTWWMNTINSTGSTLLVNNSWSGSVILTRGDSVGAYDTRAFQLHDDTGDNAGEKPDMIFVYMGTNDVNVHASNIGTTDSIDFDNIDALRAKDPEALTVLEAYAIMIDNISSSYPDAEIYCMNILNCRSYYGNETKTNSLTSFNAGTKVIAEQFGATYVDICNGTGINEENMEEYIPIYDDDNTANNYHPNKEGMDLIAECVIEAVMANSSYAPTDSEFLALVK